MPHRITFFSLTLLLAAAMTVSRPALAQDQVAAIPDPGPPEHLLFGVEDIAWVDGPGSLEPGAQVAILEGDPSAPGVFTLRIRMPDGFRISPHWHPNPERLTVISGVFRLGDGETFDAAATTPLRPGSYTSMPPGMRHFAVTEGETVIQLTSTGPWVITYVHPEDDPRRRE